MEVLRLFGEDYEIADEYARSKLTEISLSGTLGDLTYDKMPKKSGMYYFTAGAANSPEADKRGIVLRLYIPSEVAPVFCADIAAHNTGLYYRWSGASAQNGWKQLNN